LLIALTGIIPWSASAATDVFGDQVFVSADNPGPDAGVFPDISHNPLEYCLDDIRSPASAPTTFITCKPVAIHVAANTIRAPPVLPGHL
jgi:hypothetical protein